jgi:hypothetical protein
MRRELRPLCVLATVILIAGIVVGIALPGVRVGHVLFGLTVLSCLAVALFLLGRRHGADQSHLHDGDSTFGMHWP